MNDKAVVDLYITPRFFAFRGTKTEAAEDVLQVLLRHDPVPVVVDQRERLAELLDLGRGEEREHAGGLAPRAALLRLRQLARATRGRDVGRETVGVTRHGVELGYGV